MTGWPDIAQRLRQFGPLGVVAMLAIFASSLLGFIVTAFLVFVWTRQSNTPLRSLGFKTPVHPAATLPRRPRARNSAQAGVEEHRRHLRRGSVLSRVSVRAAWCAPGHKSCGPVRDRSS